MKHIFRVCLCCVFMFSVPTFAQQKVKGTSQPSYQSIFQEYYDLASPHNRMERFSFGVGAQFATILPMKRLGQTNRAGTLFDAAYSTFFNFQGRAFVRFFYNIELYVVGGLTQVYADIPIRTESFQHASIRSFPAVLGIKYRILKSDFVPFVFAGAGLYFSRFSVSEEITSRSASQSKTALGYQFGVGAEIFIQPKLGFAFEAGFEQIRHGSLTLDAAAGFQDGPFTFKGKSGGVLVTSSLFYEF